MAVDEERELSQAYRAVRDVRKPEGQGLNDLYVRFFRMAERRIAEKTGRGVVCFISNYSWLDGLSFTGMRERYLDAFDAIRIDCLNGRQVQDRQNHPRRPARPQHLLHAGRPGGHPGWHGHNYLNKEDRPRARRIRRIPPPVGTGQAVGTERIGGNGTGGAVPIRQPVAAIGPALCGCGS